MTQLQTAAAAQIEKLQNLLNLENQRLQIINCKLATYKEADVLAAFKKIGVEVIKEPNYFFTQVQDYKNEPRSLDELAAAPLLIDYRVRCTTFKMIRFAGYTSSGDGRNRKQREAKANSTKEKIETLSGYKCYINPYAVEAKNETENTFTISISI